MKEVVLLTNILTPYRRYFYDLLKQEFQKNGIGFHVILMAAGEPNRTWNYQDLKTDYTILLKGHTITLKKYYRYVQFNTGLTETLDSLSPALIVCGGSYLSRTVQNAVSYAHKHRIPVWFWNESTRSEQTNSSFVSAVLERIRRHTLSRYDGFWIAGKLAGEFVQYYSGKKAPLIRVPNLINPALYAGTDSEDEIGMLREKYGLRTDSLILFTPARLSEDKGLLQFLDLLKQCSGERLEWVIAGDGPLRNALEEAGKKTQFSVKLLGSKKAEEVAELYHAADLFALPSLGDPNPLSVIEASWAGLPLIVSEHVGNWPELVHEENGVVFSYQNSSEACRSISRLFSLPEAELKQMGSCSRQYAESQYDPERETARLVQEIRKEALR